MIYQPQSMILLMPQCVTDVITTLVNQVLNTGIFPNKLTIAKSNPIFKKDDNTLFTFYIPNIITTCYL